MVFLLSPVLANYATSHVTIIVMTNSLPFKASGTTNPFDDYFSDTHGGTTNEEDGELVWDGDVDECEMPDSMDDND